MIWGLRIKKYSSTVDIVENADSHYTRIGANNIPQIQFFNEATYFVVGTMFVYALTGKDCEVSLRNPNFGVLQEADVILSTLH